MTNAGLKNVFLHKIVRGDKATLIMEAHNGLSARIAEVAGFGAIWASGLTISSSMGARDCNEISWTQALSVLEHMVDKVHVPILFDGDTGFGNFNNFRRLVYKLEKLGISGVVIEDKCFPKLNSFAGPRQELADVAEFCGKLRAGLDTRRDDSFAVIARTEALVAGAGMEEALARADAYVEAGADAIFIHSKQNSPDEIFDFLRRWNRRAPVVVAPTTYYSVSLKELEGFGVTCFICANQSMRASAAAMRRVCERILAEQGLISVEKDIASIADIFGILDYEELASAEAKYLPEVIN